MVKVSAKQVIKTSIIAALTFTAGLIWRDFIIAFVETILPPGDALWYKLIAAILSTCIVVLLIVIFIKSEQEAEDVLKKFGEKPKKRKKKR